MTRLPQMMIGFCLLWMACTPEREKTEETVIDYQQPGPYLPGRQSTVLMDDARDRLLTIEAWYPSTVSAPESTSILDFIANPQERSAYEALLAAAPPDCPSQSSQASVAAEQASGPWPLIVLSHCSGCTRFSTATVAEHLASYGFVVVAPDHIGDTLFDTLAQTQLPLDATTLAVREADLEFTLDAALNGELGVEVRPEQIGVMGHSFGAVTAAFLLQNRRSSAHAPKAGMVIAAPPENPFLPGVQMANLTVPLLFESLAEDHSIGLAGNLLMYNNYQAAPDTAWWVSMADAGHWSPSDLVGLTDDFMPGCGEDSREESKQNFSYIAPSTGKSLTAALAAAFFDHTLNAQSTGEDYLLSNPDAALSFEMR